MPTLGTLGGAPVYAGYLVERVSNPACGQRVMLGIGPEGAMPVAYVVLCPTEGVRHLVADLQDAAAPLAEHHNCDGHGP